MKLDNIVTFAGLLGQSAIYVQIIKIFMLKSSYAVSFIGNMVALMSMIFWLFYGISNNIKPLIITNIYGLVGITILIIEIIYYAPHHAY